MKKENTMQFQTLKDFLKWKNDWARKAVAIIKDGKCFINGVEIKIQSGILTQIGK